MVEWKTVYEVHINHNASKGCHTSHTEPHTHTHMCTYVFFFMVEINLLGFQKAQYMCSLVQIQC